jgi:predicted nuclease of predicted toxin-antitoxin system
MNILIDMNLSPSWVGVFKQHGWQACHWSSVGNPDAPDRDILRWARDNGYIVFTHDLDFGAILTASRAQGPSVIQVRTQDVSPGYLEETIIKALSKYESVLKEGALIIVDEIKTRVRILPLNR